MLYTKFFGARSVGSGYEKKIFNIYEHGGYLGHVTSIMFINIHFLLTLSLHIKFGLKCPSGFSEEQV